MFGCLSRVGGQSVRGGDPWEVVVCVFDEHLDRAVPGEVVQCVPEHVLVEERVAPVREEPCEPGLVLVGDHRDDLAVVLSDGDPATERRRPCSFRFGTASSRARRPVRYRSLVVIGARV